MASASEEKDASTYSLKTYSIRFPKKVHLLPLSSLKPDNWYHLYPISVLLNYPFLLFCYNYQIVTFQFTGTFHQTVHLTLFSPRHSHIIADLDEGFYPCAFPDNKVHLLVVTGAVIEQGSLCVISPPQQFYKYLVL